MKLLAALLLLFLITLTYAATHQPARTGVNEARFTPSKATHDADRSSGRGTPAPVRATPTAASRSRTRGSTGTGPLNWHALAQCESTNNPRAVSPNGRYFGLYQFDLATWRSVGGHGNPTRASRAEQTHRARLLYNQRGRAPWPTCGGRL